MSAKYLASNRELSEFCDQARKEGRIALDTEFHRERRYYAKLALIQLAVRGREVLVDPLARMDLEPLERLFSDPTVIKVLHAASQDLEIFYHRTKELPQSVFDTQIAAAILGMGAQISLAGLVEGLLGVRLEKGESFTDWLKRPLRPKQEIYAIADVQYLLALHDKMDAMLKEMGRGEWVVEECRRYERLEHYEIPEQDLFRRVKRFHGLNPRGLAVLRELAIWREREARKRDRPRRSVIGDEVLLEVARSSPKTREELQRIRGLHPREIQRSGTGMLKTVTRGLNVPEDQCPILPKRRPLGGDAELAASFVQSFLKVYCNKLSIDASMITNSSELEALVADHLRGDLDPGKFSFLQGWRGELVGGELLAFLRGRISVRLDTKTAMPVFDTVQ